jgi:hypothetical protein
MLIVKTTVPVIIGSMPHGNCLAGQAQLFDGDVRGLADGLSIGVNN